MSNNWPTAPLIRVIRGRDLGELKENMIAARIDDSGNYIGARCVFAREVDRDSIDEWEEVTAVPTAALEELKEVWKGFGMYDADGSQRVTDAITSILSHLPADKPSALDRAVTEVKGAKGTVLHLADFGPEGRLALLLGDLATLQAADHKTPTLAMIARTCIEWVNLTVPEGDALSEVKARVESDPDWGGFAVMASLAGDLAAGIDDGLRGDPEKYLLTIAQYALAWAAQIIEEEDK